MVGSSKTKTLWWLLFNAIVKNPNKVLGHFLFSLYKKGIYLSFFLLFASPRANDLSGELIERILESELK